MSGYELLEGRYFARACLGTRDISIEAESLAHKFVYGNKREMQS